MRKIILMWLFTIFITSWLFPSGNYETVATINIGDGPDEFLIKNIPESGDYLINTYITENNEFCILFPNNNLIRKYCSDFSSYEEIPVSDSLIKTYSNKGDVEFIEAFMVGKDNDVWYYFWSYKPRGSAIIHQNTNESIEIYHISDASLYLVSFIAYNNNNYLYGDWYFNKKHYQTSVCLSDLNKSENFMDLVNMRTDSIYLGIDLKVARGDTKVRQEDHKLFLSGSENKVIDLQFEGPHIEEHPDYDISHWPEVDKNGNIVTVIRKGNSIHIMRRSTL